MKVSTIKTYQQKEVGTHAMQKATLIVESDLQWSTTNSMLAQNLFRLNKCITSDRDIHQNLLQQTQPINIS